jgi:hypothetical protein
MNELILTFLNSKDVADHQRKLGRTFNLLEASIIINQSFRPLEEKFQALRRIFELLEDMFTPANFHLPEIASIKKELSDLLVKEEQLLADFRKSGQDAIYTIELARHNTASGDPDFPTPKIHPIFSRDLERAEKFARWMISEEENDLTKGNPICVLRISKNTFDSRFAITCDYNSSIQIIDIEFTDRFRPIKDDSGEWPPSSENPYSETLDSFLGYFPFDISVPFEKGDVVEFLLAPDLVVPGVLESKPGYSSDGKKLPILDISDLAATLFLVRQGELIWDYRWPYFNIRYRREPLIGSAEILTQLGAFLRDEITIQRTFRPEKKYRCQ